MLFNLVVKPEKKKEQNSKDVRESAADKLTESEDHRLQKWLKVCQAKYFKSLEFDKDKQLDILSRSLEDQMDKTLEEVGTSNKVNSVTLSEDVRSRQQTQSLHNQFETTRKYLSTMREVLNRTSREFHAISYKRRVLFDVHVQCRNQNYPGTSISRFHVPDNKVDWNSDWPGYETQVYWNEETEELYTLYDPDPISNPLSFNRYDTKQHVNRISMEQFYKVDNGLPLNLAGRTGNSYFVF